MPASGARFNKYGGHTTCFCMKTAEGLIIIDAGTGISLMAEQPDGELLPATLLFTHFHLDHILALPVLKRLYNPKSSLQLMADSVRQPGWRSALTNLFTKPYWPLAIADMKASLDFRDLPADPDHLKLYGVNISWCPLFHPQSSLAYKLETSDRSVVIVTDHECGDSRLDADLLQFCAKADYLIYDAQYLPGELAAHRGWGHSSWKEGVEIAARAGVGELILTHHDYKREDDAIDSIVADSRRCFPKTRAVHDLLQLF